jgi:hypothetical protein
MSVTTLTLTIEPGMLAARSSWLEFESLVVQMSCEVPLQALEEALADAQERLIDSVRGPRWVPCGDGRHRLPARAGDGRRLHPQGQAHPQMR